MTKDELKIGLEELADRFSEGWHEGIKIDASDIMLLSKAAEALAQPEQEPVEWPRTMERGALVQWLHFEMVQHTLDEGTIDKLIEDAQAIPATPPQRTWVGLTDEETQNLWQNTSPYYDHQDFARAIEAKLKEKNGA